MEGEGSEAEEGMKGWDVWRGMWGDAVGSAVLTEAMGWGSQGRGCLVVGPDAAGLAGPQQDLPSFGCTLRQSSPGVN